MTSPVEKLGFALVYADDLNNTIEYYKKYFGYEVDPAFKMGENEVYGRMGPVGLWIGGGHKPVEQTDKTIRATFMLFVKSAHDLFDQVQNDGVRVYQEKPIEMQGGQYWFQMRDPNGNVLDILGGK